MKEEQNQKIEKLARDVLRLSRNQLLVNLRFLDAALSRLELIPLSEIALATDGHFLAYDPKHILSGYKKDRNVPIRDYLHVVFHCIYSHMFVHTLVNHTAWDLACDIAVEYSITGLGLKATTTERERRQNELCQKLQKDIGQLTAERIYRHFLDTELTPIQMAEMRGLFYADSHQIWYMSEAEKAALGFDQLVGSGVSSSGEWVPVIGSEEDWKGVAQRMQVDLETFSRRQGNLPGGLMQNLRSVNRERYDYTEFLKKFAVRGEVMKVNDDEFDNIFYTYGLRLYDNMPLVEPLEYKEVKRIREFVIAIDTSGSVAGELVQSFVEKTYNIMKSTESFFSKINLHIIQCDATIQEDVRITSQEEFDVYLKNMKIHGLGGTDFRPVFGYVQYLQEQQEFTNLKGLIYFTDGYGTFPEKMPEYQTAFVFLDDAHNNPEVPPWAIKLVLRKDDI